jgi:hypothetical protein
MTSTVSSSSSLTSSMLSFLSDLIRLRSVCGVNAEHLVAERICTECQSLKLKYDLVSAPDQEYRPNVIVTAGIFHYYFDVSKLILQFVEFRKWSFKVFVCRTHGYSKCGK